MKLSLVLAAVLLAGSVATADEALDAKFQSLKDAVTRKSAPEVKKLSLEIFPLVEQALREPAPQAEEERETWNNHISHAKAVGLFGEYALFATALESPAAIQVDLIATLEAANPKSQYLDAAYGPYLVALAQTGAAAKVPAVAEKALANFPENEDLLLVLADNAVNRNQPERALVYANRLVAVLAKHSRPEGITTAQWDRKRTTSMGRGYWISGVIYGERGQYLNADKNLRAALPLIQGNEAMMGAALFYLGMANYQLGKMTLSKARVLEAARFSDQAAALNSPYADQARHNALVMKNEAARMR